MKIPPGTQNGKILRLRGEGIPYLHNESRRGDLYIKVRIEIPVRLSGKARDLLKEFSQIQGENENPRPVRLSDL